VRPREAAFLKSGDTVAPVNSKPLHFSTAPLERALIERSPPRCATFGRAWLRLSYREIAFFPVRPDVRPWRCPPAPCWPVPSWRCRRPDSAAFRSDSREPARDFFSRRRTSSCRSNFLNHPPIAATAFFRMNGSLYNPELVGWPKTPTQRPQEQDPKRAEGEKRASAAPSQRGKHFWIRLTLADEPDFHGTARVFCPHLPLKGGTKMAGNTSRRGPPPPSPSIFFRSLQPSDTVRAKSGPGPKRKIQIARPEKFFSFESPPGGWAEPCGFIHPPKPCAKQQGAPLSPFRSTATKFRQRGVEGCVELFPPRAGTARRIPSEMGLFYRKSGGPHASLGYYYNRKHRGEIQRAKSVLRGNSPRPSFAPINKSLNRPPKN